MRSPSVGGWFVYILRCGDGTFYTGITKDVGRRCRQHNEGSASRYTRSRRPVRLVYQERQPDQSAALRREAGIKAMSHREKGAISAVYLVEDHLRPAERGQDEAEFATFFGKCLAGQGDTA
jgi:predicted GIY-YIG superfamily endonuclease